MSIKRNFAYSGFLTMAGYVFPLITYPYVSRVLGVTNIGKCNFIDNIIQCFVLISMLGIATVGSHLIRAFFTEADFSFEKCMELKRTYDTFVPPSQSVTCCKDGPTRIYPLSFGCNLTRKQMIGITACANAYHLFCISTLHVEDMEALLSCKKGFCIRVNNIRHVAILFDTLLEHSFIQAKWQSVLSNGRFLQTKDGKGFVSASSLSSALSALRNNMTSTGYGIRRAIDELREW